MKKILVARKALGKNGTLFTYYKFRTMVENAERLFEELAAQNGIDGLGKIINDTRITRFGRWARPNGFDEIPQVYNIINGDMTIVGIRLRPESEWTRFPEYHKKRALKYKPGLVPPVYADGEGKSMESLLESERKYLDQKEKSPVKTDIKYFFKVLYNYAIKGVRSR